MWTVIQQCSVLKKVTCILRDTYRWRLQVNDNNTVNGQGRQNLAQEISQLLNSPIAASFEIPGRRDSVSSMLTEGMDAPSMNFVRQLGAAPCKGGSKTSTRDSSAKRRGAALLLNIPEAP